MTHKSSGLTRRGMVVGTTLGTAGLAAACSNSTTSSDVAAKPQQTDTIASANAPTLPNSALNVDVVVIGAGLSGLNTTLLLEEMGYSVTLIEGRDRVGGRLYTMDDVPGFPEAGGSGIGASYGRLLNAIDTYGVELGPERPRTVPQRDISMINLRGQHIQFSEWATHPLNPMPEAHKATLPWIIQYGLYAKANPLTSPEQFVDPKFAEHDISTYQFFKDRGFNQRAIELAAGTNMSYGDERGPHALSALMMHNIIAFGQQSSQIKREGSPFAGLGGNQRIPEGMSRGVQTDIHLNTKVVRIRDTKSGAEAHLENGQVVRGKKIVVTIPFSALRLIDLDINMPDKQQRAIRTLGYTNVTHISYVPTRKFWEEDGLPPSMWTDGPTARFNALRNNPDKPNEITSFMLFANDRTANHFDRLGPSAANKFALDYLARIRPSTKGALEMVKFWSWQLDPFAGGAYAAWNPGQLSSFGATMSKPAGHVHFAGEHTSQAARGMEGAMESGERAAFEVAENL